MKKRVLVFLLAVALLLTTLPLSVFAQNLPAANPGEKLGGTGVSRLNGDNVGMSTNSAWYQTGYAIDYCAVLGITKTTAEEIGKTIRMAFQNTILTYL